MSQSEPGVKSRSASGSSRKGVEPTLPRYAVCYLLYLVVLAACYVNFFVWDQVVKQIIVTWLLGNIITEAFYAFSMLLVGVVLFVVAIVAEHFLRTSVPKGQLRAQFTWIIVRLVSVAVAALLIITAIQQLVRR